MPAGLIVVWRTAGRDSFHDRKPLVDGRKAGLPPNRIRMGKTSFMKGTQKMTDYRVHAGDSHEDQFTAALESYSSKAPSSFFLGAALASIGASLAFKLAGKDHQALFVGQWAAPFLLLGIYNKMVKQHGSDADAQPVRHPHPPGN